MDNMAKADEKGSGSFPHRTGRGRLFHCARVCLERLEVGEGFRTGIHLIDYGVNQELGRLFRP